MPWWLDAVCGEHSWDVSVVERGGNIVASMPFYVERKAVFSLIKMPKLTQTLGPWVRCEVGQKYATRLSSEKDLMSELIESLPNFDFLSNPFRTKCPIGSRFIGKVLVKHLVTHTNYL